MNSGESHYNFPNDVVIEFEKFVSQTSIPKKKEDKICENFRDGKCQNAACTVLHVLTDENIVRRARKEVCKYWLRGLCAAEEDCPWLHEYTVPKIPKCIYVQKLGECENPECIFRHSEETQNVPRCAAYERGFCSYGPKCRLRHVRSQACPSYLAGFCPLGIKCRLKHLKMIFYDEESVRERVRQHMSEKNPSLPSFSLSIICDLCRDPGHIAPQCPGREGRVFDILHQIQEPGAPPRQEGCYYCGQSDHMARTCPERTRMIQNRGPRVYENT